MKIHPQTVLQRRNFQKKGVPYKSTDRRRKTAQECFAEELRNSA